LYDAFQLQVRYHRPRHEVTIRVTIRADSLNHINGTVDAIKPPRAEKKTETGSHVLSAPSSAPSGAPIAGESALTSGYLLVEAQALLPGKPRGVGGKNGDAGSERY
jgi:hypothetical protein